MTNSRRKGKRGELEVVHFWKDLYPNASRHLEFQSNEADKGIDVWLNKEQTKGVQVKLGSKVPKKVYKYLDQIQIEDGFVQAKRDYKDFVVIIEAEKFKEMKRKLEELKNE